MTEETRAGGAEAAPPGPTAATAPLALLDRERSILQFNRRVLAQARRPDVLSLIHI